MKKILLLLVVGVLVVGSMTTAFAAPGYMMWGNDTDFDMRTATLEERIDFMQEQVDKGYLTQEDADWMINRMKAQEEAGFVRGTGRGFGRGFGACHGNGWGQ
ncbi:MAG: hypothetical protein K8R73_05395 [Clostridiales bacterium]|nr:hypothetical protein [Clostridiales bacterium]